MTSHDKLKAAIAQSRRTEIEFFQAAYLWRYKKVHNCVNDVCQYRLNAVIPKYVLEFLEHHS
jgi:hypothetical protein